MKQRAARMSLGRLLSVSTGSRFRKNFVKVARANLIALAMPILATPILTRLFSPEDYSALAVFISVLALLLAFCTWRFDWVLPNARATTMAASVFAAGAIVLVVICLALVLALPFTTLSIFDGTPLGQLGNLLFLLPVALAGGGLRQMFSGWFVRQGDLTAVSHTTVVQSAVNVVAGLGAGVAKLGALGLIVATVIAAWAGTGTLVRQAGRDLASSLRQVSLRSLRAAIQRHGSNASWSTLVAIVNALSLSAPILTLAHFYQPHEVGWYSMMYRLVGAPMGVLTSALGQSFWSQAAEYARAKQIAELSQLYRKTTLHLGYACAPIVIVCLAGPFVIGPLLGSEEWGGAGYVLAAMTPLFVGSILFSPTNHLVVLNMQHMQLLVDFLRLILVIASIVIADYLEMGFAAVVGLASFSSFIGHAVLFFIHLRMHRDHE